MTRSSLCCCLAALISCPAIVLADTFLLRSGGQVRGTWVNRDAPATADYLVETEFGGQIELRREQVRDVLSPHPHWQEYEKLRTAAADTVSAHEQLAAWCQEHRLDRPQKTHLQRILELDPDHAEARRTLGYRLVRGKWMTRDDDLASRGYQRFEGRYRTSQEIEILKARMEQKAVAIQWKRNVKLWRDWLRGSKRELAEQNLRSIRDPAAISPLKNYLYEEGESVANRLLYLEALSAIPSPAARSVLVEVSLTDKHPEVRFAALESATRSDAHDILVRYVAALGSNSNVVVNRAASALAELGNPDAVPPLIDAVVTTHKRTIPGNPGGTRATFGPNGAGFGVGGERPRILKGKVPNPEVVKALSKLTGGVSHGYDQQAWKRWHAVQRSRTTFNSRRD